MAAKNLSVSIDVLNMPELIASLRSELASLLREAADGMVYPQAAREIRQVADVFEAALSDRSDIE
jgi:hypothetical protein